MSAPVAFQGRIPVSGHTAPTLSAFRETSWDTMSATIPGQNPAAASKTAWDTMTDDAEQQVYFAKALEFDWS